MSNIVVLYCQEIQDNTIAKRVDDKNLKTRQFQEVTRKLAVLEKQLQQQRTTIFSEELDSILPKVNIDELLDEVPKHSDTTESESDNSTDDEPFYSVIADHKLHDNGSYKFLCKDDAGATMIWCDYINALTNVGKKVMRKYVKEHSLDKSKYLSKTDQPRKKSETRKSVNKRQLQLKETVTFTKILQTKQTNNGVMYKVMKSDLTSGWFKKKELEDHNHLFDEYKKQTKENEPKKRVTTEARKPGKQKTKSIQRNRKRAKTSDAHSKKSKKSNSKEKNKTETGTIDQNEKESVFICKLHHLKFESFKAEGNKKWFSVNQRFSGVKCHKCRVSISDSANDNCFVPKNSSPAYICINSIKGCKKCLCNKCCIELTMKGAETGNKRTTRSSLRKN